MKIEEQINLLCIFHYVLGGLRVLFGCFGFLYVAMGVFVGLIPYFDKAPAQNGPPPFIFGLFFIVFGVLFALVNWALAGCTLLSGRFMARRVNRKFSIVVAAINCAFVPFGTILGVFDIVTLTSDEGRALYGEKDAIVPPAI